MSTPERQLLGQSSLNNEFFRFASRASERFWNLHWVAVLIWMKFSVLNGGSDAEE